MNRVLLVDDERDALEVLEWQLGDSGTEVRTALDGDAAIEIGRKFRPDVLITDYCLSGDRTGTEVIRALRAELPALRAVLVTGLPPHQLLAELSRLGPVALVRKPFRWAELEDVLAMRRTQSGVIQVAPPRKTQRQAY